MSIWNWWYLFEENSWDRIIGVREVWSILEYVMAKKLEFEGCSKQW